MKTGISRRHALLPSVAAGGGLLFAGAPSSGKPNGAVPGSYPASYGSLIGLPPPASMGTAAYGQAPIFGLFERLKGCVESDVRVLDYSGEHIRTAPHWIRDHVGAMRAWRYWDADVTSYLDLILRTQTPAGFFFELISPLPDPHAGRMGPPELCLLTPENGLGLARLELEADVEYLVVEGVYMAWQATGDDAYLRRHLPRLEKALRYCMSDAKRWDATHRLMKRIRTIDTWDFANRPDSGPNRAIMPTDPMGIMHGDNSGLYQAMRQLAAMYRVTGAEAKAKGWESEAAGLRERANKLLWNGRFYIHFHCLDAADFGIDEREALSFSNTYDINRGMATHAMAVSILDQYDALRKRLGGKWDDFRFIYPPYPKFGAHVAGAYCNGGLGSLVAGELALAAFEHGREAYGLDILERMGRKIVDDGKLSFFYNLKGEDARGGPRGWAAAVVLTAMTRGLAGVVDNASLFSDITLSPRWAVRKDKAAHVRIAYAASGREVEYQYSRDDAGANRVRLLSTHRNVVLRLLLPARSVAEAAHVDGRAVKYETEKVEQSVYAVVKLSNPKPGATVVVKSRPA